MRRVLLWALALAPFVSAVSAGDGKTEVAVLAAIHSGHLKSKAYSVRVVIDIVRRYKPEIVLVEVPPDQYNASVERIDKTGFKTTKKDLAGLRWISAFPEIYRGIIPLRKEMKFRIEPVSGWTPAASGERRKFWKDRGNESDVREMRRVWEAVRSALNEIRARENDTENPKFLNSQHLTDLRQLERTAWSACFDKGLGRGGEVAINEAHWKNIAKQLDTWRGKRVLIVYGAAHRYWFLRELRRRRDVTLIDIAAYLP